MSYLLTYGNNGNLETETAHGAQSPCSREQGGAPRRSATVPIVKSSCHVTRVKHLRNSRRQLRTSSGTSGFMKLSTQFLRLDFE